MNYDVRLTHVCGIQKITNTVIHKLQMESVSSIAITPINTVKSKRTDRDKIRAVFT